MNWWQALKERLLGRPDATEEDEGAAHPGDEPESLHPGRRRLKEEFTSHWDLDYMPREELEKLEPSNNDSDSDNR
jgi:hypothetical protein